MSTKLVEEQSAEKNYEMTVLILKSHVEKIISNISNYKTFDEYPKKLMNALMSHKIDGYTLTDLFKTFYKYSAVQLSFAEYLYLLFNKDFKSRPLCKNSPKCNNIPNFRGGTRGYNKECNSCYTARVKKNTQETNKLLETTKYIDYEEEFKDLITHKDLKEYVEDNNNVKCRKEYIKLNNKTKRKNSLVSNNKVNSKMCHRFVTCETCNKSHAVKYNSYSANKTPLDIHICPNCSPSTNEATRSDIEKKIIKDVIKRLHSDIITNDKKLLYPKELDCVAGNIAFEIDGDRYHTEAKLKSTTYHLEKTEAVEALNMKLVRINTSAYAIDRNAKRSREKYFGNRPVDKKLIRIFSWLFPNQTAYKIPVYDLKKYDGPGHIRYMANARIDVEDFFNFNHINGIPMSHELHHAQDLKCKSMYIDGISGKIFASIIFNSVKTEKGKDAYIYRYANRKSCLTERGSTLKLLAESIKNEYQNIYYLRDRNWDFLDSPNYSLKNFNFMKHIQILPPKFILKDFGNDVYLDYKINSDNSIESVDSTYHNGKIFTEKDFELTKRYNPSINDYELLADYGKIWNSGYELLKINVY